MIGKWLMIDAEEYFLIGVVTERVGRSHFLLEMHPPKAPAFMRLFAVEELATEKVMIFETESDLNAWLDWEPDEDGAKRPKVVNIKD